MIWIKCIPAENEEQVLTKLDKVINVLKQEFDDNAVIKIEKQGEWV